MLLFFIGGVDRARPVYEGFCTMGGKQPGGFVSWLVGENRGKSFSAGFREVRGKLLRQGWEVWRFPFKKG